MVEQDAGGLHLAVTEDDGAAVVAARGEVDIHTCGDLEKALVDLSDGQRARVTLDLAEVSFIDSSGLRSLIVGHRALSESGTTFDLRNVSAAVARLLSVTGLDDLFGTTDA